MSNPTITDQVIYYDCPGDSTGEIVVANQEMLTRDMCQRAQLLNIASNNPGLPSIRDEYNRIRMVYPTSIDVHVQNNGQDYLAAVSGPTQVSHIDTDPATGSKRIMFGHFHGIYEKFIEFTINNPSTSTIIEVANTNLVDGNGNLDQARIADILSIPNIEEYYLFLSKPPDQNSDAKTHAYNIKSFSQTQSGDYQLELATESALVQGDFGGGVFITKPITGVQDGEFVGVATRNEDGAEIINVNFVNPDNGTTKLGDGEVPTNTFVYFSDVELIALNESIYELLVIDYPQAYLMQPLYFLEDAVDIINSKLQARYASPPTVSFENNNLVSSFGVITVDLGRFNIEDPNRSVGMITIPEYYYDNAFGLLGNIIQNQMNRFWINACQIKVNNSTKIVFDGKYNSIETLIELISALFGSVYTIQIVRTTGTTQFIGGVRTNLQEPTLDAALDTRPIFRQVGKRAEETSAAPYRPRVYQIRILGPHDHSISFKGTSSTAQGALVRLLGFEQADYTLTTGEIRGSIQYNQETRGQCVVTISTGPKRFVFNLSNADLTIRENGLREVRNLDGVVELKVDNMSATLNGTQAPLALGFKVGDVVGLRFDDRLARAVVVPNEGIVNDFKFSLMLGKKAFVTLLDPERSTLAEFDQFLDEILNPKQLSLSIYGLNGNRLQLDVSGYPMSRVMSPAPLVGLDDVTTIVGGTELPNPMNAFSTFYYVRMITEADGREPQQKPVPTTTTEGDRSLIRPYGFRMGGRDWVGGAINVPMVLTTPVRVSYIKVKIVFPDNTPVDLTGQTFFGAISLSGQDRVAYYAAQSQRMSQQ